LIFIEDSPCGASAFTVKGTLKVALPEYVSVLIPKFGSIFTVGRVPEIRPRTNGPSAIVIRVGIGPPDPWVMEYIFHPPPMLAVTFAVPRPPAGTLDGETLIDSETGPCAAVVKAQTATAKKQLNKIESLEIKI
jgi:hypothetical protein